MSTPTPPAARPAWVEKHVAAEAVGFANRVANDFRISLDTALRHAPNPKDPAQRSMLLDEFFNILADVAARLTADFGSPDPGVEKLFIEIVQARFANTRNERALKANSQKPKLVDQNGAPTP